MKYDFYYKKSVRGLKNGKILRFDEVMFCEKIARFFSYFEDFLRVFFLEENLNFRALRRTLKITGRENRLDS